MSIVEKNNNVDNKVYNSKITTFIGRDYITINNSENVDDLFETPIFLHFLGKKVSRIIFGMNANISELLVLNTKIIFLLFNDIIISLSDATQSEFVYGNSFYRELLSLRDEMGEPVITIAGTKRGTALESFLKEREEFYHKPGFYTIEPLEVTSMLDSIIDSIQPKSFDTKKMLSYNWKSIFSNLQNGTNTIDSYAIEIQNIFVSKFEFFQSTKSDDFIRIPEKLQGFPFIWDSVEYLKLTPDIFNPSDVFNIESFLATEWIKCYLNNYKAKVPDTLIGARDSSMGIDDVVRLGKVYSFLKKYRIITLIKKLSLRELIESKSKCSYHLQKIIYIYVNSALIFKDEDQIQNKIGMILSANLDLVEKIYRIIQTLWNAERVV